MWTRVRTSTKTRVKDNHICKPTGLLQTKTSTKEEKTYTFIKSTWETVKTQVFSSSTSEESIIISNTTSNLSSRSIIVSVWSVKLTHTETTDKTLWTVANNVGNDDWVTAVDPMKDIPYVKTLTRLTQHYDEGELWVGPLPQRMLPTFVSQLRSCQNITHTYPLVRCESDWQTRIFDFVFKKTGGDLWFWKSKPGSPQYFWLLTTSGHDGHVNVRADNVSTSTNFPIRIYRSTVSLCGHILSPCKCSGRLVTTNCTILYIRIRICLCSDDNTL